MEINNNRPRSHYIWAALVVALVLIVIIVAAVWLFSDKRSATQAPASNVTKPQTDGRGDSYSNDPFPGFAKELLLSDSTPPQYFNNVKATGAMFIVQQTPDQIKASYKQLLGDGPWVIQAGFPADANFMLLNNTKTKQVAQIQINPVTKTSTGVVLGISK